MGIRLLGDDIGRNDRLSERLAEKKMDVLSVAALSDESEFRVWSGNSIPTCEVNVWHRSATHDDIHVEYEKARKDLEYHPVQMIAVRYQAPNEIQPTAHVAISANGIIRSFVHEYDFHRFLIDMIGELE